MTIRRNLSSLSATVSISSISSSSSPASALLQVVSSSSIRTSTSGSGAPQQPALFQCNKFQQAQTPVQARHHGTATTSSMNSMNSANSAAAAASSSVCSNRGRAAVELLPSYLADARTVARYSPTHNPHGALQLGVAETQLLEDWLVPALNDADNNMPALEANAIYYQPTQGRDDCKDALANYIEQELCGLRPGQLDREGLIVGAGCNAVLENLCITLADAGDAVLIPTPYYAAFEFDLGARAALVVEPVTTESHHDHDQQHQHQHQNHSVKINPTLYYPNRAALDAAYERAALRGHAPKILLLSHPMNPLGICYPAETVLECITWCRERHVHLISDEIYAGSVYGNDHGFVSALRLASSSSSSSQSSSPSSSSSTNNENKHLSLGPYVHWVYALSKDFGLSGMRVGAAYTENTEIRLPLQKLNDLCQISSQTQLWTTHTMKRRIPKESASLSALPSASLPSETWVSAFRRENHRRLRTRAAAVAAILDQYQIPYLPPTAGLFLWMDLSRYLPAVEDGGNNSISTPAERERTLYLELVHDFGLLLTPGESMRNERPGFFRCVFTAASEDEFVVALQRLETFAKTKATLAL